MAKSTLNKIKTLLGMESEIELGLEGVLEDGTKIGTDGDEFKEGGLIFVIAEDGEKMPLPTGSYSTNDGVTLEVTDGEIVSISKEQEETEAKSKDKEEEEMKEEQPATEEVDMSAYATKEQLVEALSAVHTELSEMITKVVTENSALKDELEKVSKLSAVKPVKHNQTNLSTNEVNIAKTGNSALDMILQMKHNN